MKRVEILQRVPCYQGFFHMYRLKIRHLLFSGSMSAEIIRELIDRGNAAAVLPYDPVRDEVLLIEQFRVGALDSQDGPWVLELVAGMIDTAETPEDVVMREAIEEAGCVIEELIPLYRYLVSPGTMNEQVSIFLGRVDTTNAGGVFGLADEGEDIKVHVLPANEAISMLQTGAINSAMPIIALQWLAMNRTELRRQWGVDPGFLPGFDEST